MIVTFINFCILIYCYNDALLVRNLDWLHLYIIGECAMHKIFVGFFKGKFWYLLQIYTNLYVFLDKFLGQIGKFLLEILLIYNCQGIKNYVSVWMFNFLYLIYKSKYLYLFTRNVHDEVPGEKIQRTRFRLWWGKNQQTCDGFWKRYLL